MALKDYYIEKAAGDAAGSLVGVDKWALKYITINRVRTIAEALDDDASGFVTIQEVNAFTRARPLDWRWVFATIYIIRRPKRFIASPIGWRTGQLVSSAHHSVSDTD